MRKTKFINPMWEDHRRPVAYVRALEVLIPGRYFNEEAVKAADDEAVIALVTAFASCSQPGMPALLVLGFEALPPAHELTDTELLPLEVLYLSMQEFFDEDSTRMSTRVHTIHTQEVIINIPEWLGEHLHTPKPNDEPSNSEEASEEE